MREPNFITPNRSPASATPDGEATRASSALAGAALVSYHGVWGVTAGDVVAINLSGVYNTVEAALPLSEMHAPGQEPVLMSVRRIRAMRPSASQMRWRWPATDPAVEKPKPE